MRSELCAAALVLALAPAGPAEAHFQELLPSTDIVPDAGDHEVRLKAIFTHPMEGGPTMDMAPPVAFGVIDHGRTIDLKTALKPIEFQGKKAFEADYALKAPGDYVFYLQPAPYWEAAEKRYLVHDVKVVVDLGGEEGWDALVGLAVEIAPLTRPYGLWTGNVFRGIVLHEGKPVPGARVEIEWVNDGSVKPPSDPFVTQVVKADSNGVFDYAIPRAGWWGFNAIVEGTLAGPDGKPAAAELGGTIWVKALDMK